MKLDYWHAMLQKYQSKWFSSILLVSSYKEVGESKATAKHMKQVTSNPQAAQINLLHYNHTQIPPKKSKNKKPKHNLPQSHDNRGQASYNSAK